jgi:NTE family protein
VSGPELSRRPRLGPALGGGSARGVAHAGVPRRLEEHRIPVDPIAGTRLDGLVGGAFELDFSVGTLYR